LTNRSSASPANPDNGDDPAADAGEPAAGEDETPFDDLDFMPLGQSQFLEGIEVTPVLFNDMVDLLVFIKPWSASDSS
jgi:hypothetical protein